MTRSLNPLAPGISARVTELVIRELVHCAYAKVRKDDVLRPIFNGPIVDWVAHIDRLGSFWSTVTLIFGRYMGSPIQVRTALPSILTALFDSWLSLFSETAERICSPHSAAVVSDSSQRIVRSLGSGFPLHRGEMLGTGENSCKQGK